jgi:VWFA-related protein
MTRLLAVGAALAIAGLGPAQDPPAPVFRGGSDGVALNVGVFDGGRPVTTLTARDFDVLDNGVRQTLSSADLSLLPIDLRLVFDTSGSISDADLAQYLRTMRDVAATLEARDRCEIVTFTSRIAQAAARQHPPVAVTLRRAGPDGTAFFDAVILSMVTVPDPDRRQVVVVLSDGRDNASFFDEAAALDAAKRADAVVYTILPGDPFAGRELSVARLRALSLLTGGDLMFTNEHAVRSLILQAIREFRQSYVLRYQVSGVPVRGWHTLDVRVRGGHRVRARTGYFGG